MRQLAARFTDRQTLIIAKPARLAHKTRFLLHVVEDTGEAGVMFYDLPQVPPRPVGKFLLTRLAAVAEPGAGLTSQRTRTVLAAAEMRGTVLSNPRLRTKAGPRPGCRHAALGLSAAAGAALAHDPRCLVSLTPAHLVNLRGH